MIGSLAKGLGTVLYVPFFVLLLPFIALGAGIIFVNATVSGLFQRARWLRGLRKDGRVTAATAMPDNTNGGTLIVDRPGSISKAHTVGGRTRTLPIFHRHPFRQMTKEWTYSLRQSKRRRTNLIDGVGNGIFHLKLARRRW